MSPRHDTKICAAVLIRTIFLCVKLDDAPGERKCRAAACVAADELSLRHGRNGLSKSNDWTALNCEANEIGVDRAALIVAVGGLYSIAEG